MSEIIARRSSGASRRWSMAETERLFFILRLLGWPWLGDVYRNKVRVWQALPLPWQVSASSPVEENLSRA